MQVWYCQLIHKGIYDSLMCVVVLVDSVTNDLVTCMESIAL